MFLALIFTVVLALSGRALIDSGRGIWARYQASVAAKALEEKDWMGAARALAQANRYDREEQKSCAPLSIFSLKPRPMREGWW